MLLFTNQDMFTYSEFRQLGGMSLFGHNTRRID